MEQIGSSDQYAKTERSFSVTSSAVNMTSGHAELNLKLWHEASI